MILGLSIPAFTLIHVIISVIAIASGLIVLVGMLGSRRLPGWTALFLLATALTSISGFLFPATAITPAQIFGYLSLAVLAAALFALYVFRLAGPWRWLYVGAAVIALYLNAFVFVVQAFAKLPVLHSLAPNATEPPFLFAEGALLAVFIVLGFLALVRFHPERHAAA